MPLPQEKMTSDGVLRGLGGAERAKGFFGGSMWGTNGVNEVIATHGD